MIKLNIFIIAFLITLPSKAALIDARAIVAAHNHLRSEVGVANIKYSSKLAVSAQSWADHLQQKNNCKMIHTTPDGKYGENLFWGSAVKWTDGRIEEQHITSKQVVDDWGSEKIDYDYTTNECTKGKMCGHYTQVIWRNSTKVGCGMAVCEESKEQVWVCRYQPAGNWVGTKPY
jgi:pathogenesis-related protein 1